MGNAIPVLSLPLKAFADLVIVNSSPPRHGHAMDVTLDSPYLMEYASPWTAQCGQMQKTPLAEPATAAA